MLRSIIDVNLPKVCGRTITPASSFRCCKIVFRYYEVHKKLMLNFQQVQMIVYERYVHNLFIMIASYANFVALKVTLSIKVTLRK